MDVTFPLLSLIPSLREKVITKADPKSFFRLHRTCHSVNEFIHKNKNISVYLDKSFLLNFYKKTGWSFVFGPEGKTQVVEVERFFGVRLDSINMNEGTYTERERLCDILKQNRITCTNLDMDPTWSAGQLETFLNIVKPIRINTTFSSSCGSKTVSLFLKLENVFDGMSKLLSTLEELEIRLGIDTRPLLFERINSLFEGRRFARKM